MRLLFGGFMLGISCLLAIVAGPVVHAGGDQRQQLQQPEATTTFFLIRHAEKEISTDEDPALTAQGRFRASKWAEVLQHTRLDAVFSTDTRRTRDTAAAIAQKQSRNVQLYDPFDIDYIEFLQQNLHKTVLVVGHSNTIPAFANGLLGVERYQQLEEDDYSSLFIVEIIDYQRVAKRLYIDAESSQ